MKKAEEIAICSGCALESCIGDSSSLCPLWKARAEFNWAYFSQRYQARKAEKQEKRGYWPEIHGALSVKGEAV